MYQCKNCGYVSKKWIGKCPNCGGWEIEEIDEQVETKKQKVSKGLLLSEGAVVKSVTDIAQQEGNKDGLGFSLKEVEGVLGKALPGAVYLIGGEPGIGKSTLLMQVLLEWAKQGIRGVYVSSEESEEQLLGRITRIWGKKQGFPENLGIMSYNELDGVLKALEKEEPKVLVFDSIQGFYSVSNEGVMGGVSQLREATFKIVNYAKSRGITTFIVGQVTKEGVVSGPKLVEHIVDAVAYLESGGVSNLRTIRCTKNRFFEVGNLGFLQMTPSGFKDARDLYEEWLKDRNSPPPGLGFGVALYGARPVIVQVQALLVDSKFANPKRTAEGISKNKLELLLAIAQEHVPRVDFSYKDVFVKVLGGINVKDPGIDLAVLAALVSAYFKKPAVNTAFVGEVGLLGRVVAPVGLDLRVKEAKQAGFATVVTPKTLSYVNKLPKFFKAE